MRRSIKIYVASSWRNELQPGVVKDLRVQGFDVYDFKDPEASFHWSDIDPLWEMWEIADYEKALRHSLAKKGFDRDMKGLIEADVCVLVLPCGNSAHLEAGYATFSDDKRVYVYIPKGVEYSPELMYKMTDGIFDSLDEIVEEIGREFLV